MKLKRFVHSEQFFAWMLLLPASLVLLTVRLWPMIQGIGLSFTNRQLLKNVPTRFIGLENYLNLFNDKSYWSSASFTIIYTLGTVILGYLLGLAIALLMNMQIKGRGIFRTFVMIPWVIPSVVAAYIWRYALNDQVGIINIVLQSLGLASKPVAFLSTPWAARMTVILVNMWRNYPFMALVLLAGLQTVSEEIKEAARIDGANIWQVFRNVTWPQLRGVTAMCTTLMFIWTFNNFDSVFLLTSGGPNEATYVLSVHAYYAAFSRMRTGYASAMATLMLVFMLIVTTIYLRLINRKTAKE
ncbi:MAG: carbohydrate ABC transporter permease [Bacillota bacterium]